MAKKESVLSLKEKESFKIEKFIFHIIMRDELKPIYLDEIILDDGQTEFFRERFKDVSEGVQHIFIDKDKSHFYEDCEKLLKNANKHFLDISQKLTAAFREKHTGNMNDGVFITSIVKVENSRRLIFLLKIDHKKVYEYKVKNNKALLTEITKTFVEDKKAIQKSALIDVSDYYSWDVLATDRTASGSNALREYFSSFLGVQEKETPSTLTTKTISAVRKWATENKDAIGLSYDVASYKNKVIDYLSGTAKYKTKDCIEAVIADESDERKETLRESLKSYFDETGLSGQSFVPNKARIDKLTKRNVRKTAEGVTILWEGDPKESNIDIPSERNHNDGLFHIVIKTSGVEIADKQ